MNKFRRRLRQSVLVIGLTALGVCIGCGRGAELARVRGVVQFDGAPVPGGRVLFTSVDKHKPAIGWIEPDGLYEMTTYKEGDGATPGQYQVSVITDMKIRGKQARVTFVGPKNRLLQVEAGQENEIEISISRANGWRQVVED